MELRSFLKEIRDISNADSPRNVKRSDSMEHLFSVVKTDLTTFYDEFVSIKRTIESEVLHRVQNDLI
jgi:hypothetical protein